MALVNQVIRPSEDPPEDDARESEAPVGANPAAASGPQLQDPGWAEAAIARPDYGERNYVGHHRMMGMRTLITGGERGIGRAVALAYAREGADVAFTYLPEDEQEAEQTVKLIEDAGSRALALPGDLQDEEFCQEAVAQTVAEFGGLNVLVTMPAISSLPAMVLKTWATNSSTGPSKPTSTPCFGSARLHCRICSPGLPSSTLPHTRLTNPAGG